MSARVRKDVAEVTKFIVQYAANKFGLLAETSSKLIGSTFVMRLPFEVSGALGPTGRDGQTEAIVEGAFAFQLTSRVVYLSIHVSFPADYPYHPFKISGAPGLSVAAVEVVKSSIPHGGIGDNLVLKLAMILLADKFKIPSDGIGVKVMSEMQASFLPFLAEHASGRLAPWALQGAPGRPLEQLCGDELTMLPPHINRLLALAPEVDGNPEAPQTHSTLLPHGSKGFDALVALASTLVVVQV